jgi:hypothetical protein
VANFVQLEQELLAHDFQGANFSCVLLLCEVHLTIAALSDLGQDLEVCVPQSGASLSKVCSLPTQVLAECLVVLGFRCGWRGRILRLELCEAVLAGVYVGQEVEIVVEEICTVSLAYAQWLRGGCLHSCVTLANRLTWGFLVFSKSSAESPLGPWT